MTPQTLFAKLWQRRVVRDTDDGRTLLYIDLHLVNEVTGPQAFEGLRISRLHPWQPASVLATEDYNVPTASRTADIIDDVARRQVEALRSSCARFGITEYPVQDACQGILHVIGPEQGATLPGMTIVCDDSHTTTYGAFATLAFDIGTSEVEHVLATQCLIVKKMKTMCVLMEDDLSPGVTSKDVVLALIGRIGTAGATGYAIEFAGLAISAMSMDARTTLYNMVIGAGVRYGTVAVDDETINYLRGRARASQGAQWDAAQAYWRTLRSDEGAQFNRIIALDATTIHPHVTWGTSPEMVVTIDGRVPNPAEGGDPIKRQGTTRVPTYMGLEPGTPLRDVALDKIFIGSCTNVRIEDLRAATRMVAGKCVVANIMQALVVPDSELVKRQAETEGFDRVFIDAGFEWHDPGCSMCLGMSDDRLQPGERCASTFSRNFEGWQGAGGRIHLASPSMAAAAAIAGHFVTVSKLGADVLRRNNDAGS